MLASLLRIILLTATLKILERGLDKGPIIIINILPTRGTATIELLFSYPSPCGDYGSYQLGISKSLYEKIEYVSVPLRGLWFLSIDDFADALKRFNQFPSPCGDYGSYRLGKAGNLPTDETRFPSPCGDYGSYHEDDDDVLFEDVAVSVPLRGLWFLSKRTIYMSEPLERFPSPCGDYGSYRQDK